MLGRLFTAQIPVSSKSSACIIDDVGTYFIDNDYRNTGESEGWLIKTGYYYDHNGNMVWTYRHSRA